VKEVDGEVWVYVQRNAMHATIQRAGYRTVKYELDKTVQPGKVYEMVLSAEAQKVQKEANRIITILCKVGVMQAEKEVLNQLGFDFGVCRHPFGEPTAEQKELIAKEIIPYVNKI
jgi:hypothetical protein